MRKESIYTGFSICAQDNVLLIQGQYGLISIQHYFVIIDLVHAPACVMKALDGICCLFEKLYHQKAWDSYTCNEFREVCFPTVWPDIACCPGCLEIGQVCFKVNAESFTESLICHGECWSHAIFYGRHGIPQPSQHNLKYMLITDSGCAFPRSCTTIVSNTKNIKFVLESAEFPHNVYGTLSQHLFTGSMNYCVKYRKYKICRGECWIPTLSTDSLNI